MANNFILRLQSPDRPGLVSTAALFLAERGANITDAQQFNDKLNGRFFMRIAFDAAPADTSEALGTHFAPIAQAANMEWSLRAENLQKKVN